jgi:hypothetical protein
MTASTGNIYGLAVDQVERYATAFLRYPDPKMNGRFLFFQSSFLWRCGSVACQGKLPKDSQSGNFITRSRFLM